MGTELEIKYAVDDLQKLDCLLCDPLVREQLTENYRNIPMETTYFDTPDGALQKRQWTLRLRTEGGESVITVKTPGEGYARGEWSCREAYLEDAVPKLVALGAPEELETLVRAETPGPICSAKFTRIAAVLQLEGARCELCGDIGRLFGGGKSLELCELELELLDGSEDAMLAYARRLAEKYGLREEKRSKFARANALAAK